MKTFVINLDRDTDRLAHIRAECARAGLTFERFSALRGDALPDELKPYFDAADPTLGNGEIGCYASHLAIMMRIARGEVETPVLVFEDDIRLVTGFRAMLSALIAALPEEWDIVRLSNAPKRAYAPVAELVGGYTLARYSVVPPSTGAYLISRSGARKFLEQAVRRLPIDQDLRRVWRWKLETYGVVPVPIIPDVLQTSSIDALAPEGARKAAQRRARMRKERRGEGMARLRWNMRTLGTVRALRAELVSLAASFMPRKKRQDWFARAGAGLALQQEKTPRP